MIICLFLFQYRSYAHELDAGRVPEGMQAVLEEVGALKQEWIDISWYIFFLNFWVFPKLQSEKMV